MREKRSGGGSRKERGRGRRRATTDLHRGVIVCAELIVNAWGGHRIHNDNGQISTHFHMHNLYCPRRQCPVYTHSLSALSMGSSTTAPGNYNTF